MRSAPISPIGMVSISVRSKPRPCAQRIRSSISSSLMSRSATVLILISSPALAAASMPRSTCARSPLRVMSLNFAGSSVSSETLMRATPQAASASACCASWLPLVVSVSSSRPWPKCRDSRSISHMMFRRTSGSPPVSLQLAHAARDEGARQPVDLLEAQQILARQEGHGLGHAIDAAEVAAVGDRDAQIGDMPAEGVDQGLFGHASSLSSPCARALRLRL